MSTAVDVTHKQSICAHCGIKIYKLREFRTSPWTHGLGANRQTGCAGRYTYATPTR